MIKGIVNGVEKDIVRIPMKGKNLAYDKIQNANINSSGKIATPQQGMDVSIAKIVIGKTYTVNSYVLAFYENEPAIGSVSYDNSRIVGTNGRPTTFTAPITGYVAFRVDGNDRDVPMCNEGTQILPYEPYGYQEGWEVRKGDGTLIWGRNDTISVNSGTLPVKGYGVPLVSVTPEGNAEQKSVNLADPSATVAGYQNSDGSIHTPGSGNERTTDYIPFTQRLYYIIDASASGNINWCFYDENKTAIYFYGGNFSPPASGYIDPTSSARYIRISWTNAATQPICVTTEQQSSFVSYNPTPTSPIDVTGCGDRTGNLFPLDATKLHVGRIENDGTIGYKVGTITVGTNSVTYQADAMWRGFYTDFIQVNENEKLTFSPNNSSVIAWSCSCYDENDSFLGKATAQSTASIRAFTLFAGTKKVRLSVTSSLTEYTITNPMLNLGSTALPYEPFGYKVALMIRGENLFDESTLENGYYAASSSQAYDSFTSDSRYRAFEINLPAGTYTLSISADVSIQLLRASNSIDGIVTVNTDDRPYSFTLSAATKVCVSMRNSTTTDNYPNLKIMLNSGSQALPYAPYHSTTTPRYLGQTPTTRKVKKLVLTGEEGWLESGTAFRLNFSPYSGNYLETCCTHYPNDRTSGQDKRYYIGSGNYAMFFVDSSFEDASAFKQFLRDQYAAGTPVTVWYVLATPETAIVNEPLMKIGTYTDTLTVTDQDVTITPAVGNDTIIVDTTLPPSKLTVVGHIRDRST